MKIEKNEKIEKTGKIEKIEKITLTKIFSLDLKDPIIVEMKENNKKDRRFSLFYKPLKIYAFGSTIDMCLKDFQEQLYLLYKVYTTRGDQDLKRGSRIQKNKFLNMVNITSSA